MLLSGITFSKSYRNQTIIWHKNYTKSLKDKCNLMFWPKYAIMLFNKCILATVSGCGLLIGKTRHSVTLRIVKVLSKAQSCPNPPPGKVPQLHT